MRVSEPRPFPMTGWVGPSPRPLSRSAWPAHPPPRGLQLGASSGGERDGGGVDEGCGAAHRGRGAHPCGHPEFDVIPWMLGATLGAMVLVLAVRRRGPAAFVSGSALVYAVFIALSKQSFCNYWWFVLGAICCGIATSVAPVNEPPVEPG